MGGIKLKKGYTLPFEMPEILMEDMAYELEAKHDGRKSFHGKAKVVFDLQARKATLLSYGTPVAEFVLDLQSEASPVVSRPVVRPLEARDSATTRRHIREFINQTYELGKLLKAKLMGPGCQEDGKSLFGDP